MSSVDVAVPNEPRQLNRNERKARESLLKLGFTPITGILRVTLRRGQPGSGGGIYAISMPEVLYAPSTDTYVVLGQAVNEDISATTKQAMAAQKKMTQAAIAAKNAGIKLSDNTEHSDKLSSSDEQVDETGLESKDIELVMSQANVPRAVAAKTLRAHNGDIVEAIMELTI